MNRGELPKYHAEDTHEAIIDMVTYNAVQEEKAKRAKRFVKKVLPKKIYPFTSIVTCEECGKNYRRKVSARGHVWVCTTYDRKGKSACPSKQIPEEVLEGITSEVLGYKEITTESVQKEIKNILVCKGTWIALQTAFLLYSELVLTNWTLQFFFGFILALVGQYVIFFVTTKGRFAQRVFTTLTYSIFFCIITSPFIMLKNTLSELHWSLALLVQAVLLFGIVTYFLRCVCPLCRTAAKNITTGWMPLIFVNIVFIITIILSSIFSTRLTGFDDPTFITFVFLAFRSCPCIRLSFQTSTAYLKRQ